ncbi:MAG: trigger factor, partial [Clostridiales bacterium]|nr:trigger factor [Candidatus Apopatousia equi]
VKFTIDLTKDEWEHELDHVYEHQKAKFKVEGFRNGKAPRKVIEKNYGESIFYNDALNECFYEYFEEVLSKEKDVEVVGNPKLDVTKLDNTGVTLVVVIDVKPEVKLGQYKNLGLEKAKVSVSKEEIKEELNKMVEKSARLVKVEREVKKGDTVIMDFTGYKDGKEFEGGKAEKFELEIGSGRFIPGFEDQIVGMKAGDEKDINVVFPADYPVEELKAKPAVFKIKLHEVREKQMPEVNDEFAKNVSEFDTLKEYEDSLKAEIEKRKQVQVDYEYEEKLIEQVANNAEVEIPQGMIDEQADMFIHDFEHRLSHQGLKLEDYVKYMGTTVEELKKSRLEDAKKTCKTRLVLEAIIKAENIKVENDDIEKAIQKQALKMGTTVEEVKKGLDEHTLSHIANDLLIEKLLDFLKENNK